MAPSQESPNAAGLVVGDALAQPVTTRSAQAARRNNPFPYGYHNSFHTHTIDSRPPSYEQAQKAKHTPPPIPQDHSLDSLPDYNCSVEKCGVVGLLMEFKDPFLGKPKARIWQKVYAHLRGTQLTISWVKFRLNSKKSIPQAGKKIASFSLQHAEVGLAVDVRAAENMPKNPVLQLLPPKMKDRLMKTKPQLFETQNEWLLRIRIEGFQFLISLESEISLLDWCEQLCMGIDLSPPIDDRSDPRYRSLPRRSRRQRQLESYADFENQATGHTEGQEDTNDRLVEQQERILRTFYPNLANPANADRRNVLSRQRPVSNIPDQAVTSGDHDMDEFDPDDVLESSSGLANTQGQNNNDSKASDRCSLESESSSEAEIKFRRRCMPIMYMFSSRGSDIIFYKGARWRIDQRRCVLRSFEMGPPRYLRNSKMAIAFRKSVPENITNNESPQAQTETSQRPDGLISYRTSSGYSRRVEDSDAISITSVANTTGSAHDGQDSVSRVVSMFNANDEISENPNPDVSMMLKEKATLQERRPSRSEHEQISQTFANLIL